MVELIDRGRTGDSWLDAPWPGLCSLRYALCSWRYALCSTEQVCSKHHYLPMFFSCIMLGD